MGSKQGAGTGPVKNLNWSLRYTRRIPIYSNKLILIECKRIWKIIDTDYT